MGTGELAPAPGRAERAARIPLIAGLASFVPAEAFLIWALGFRVQPHQVGFACIVAAVSAPFLLGPMWLAYRVRIRRARRLASGSAVRADDGQPGPHPRASGGLPLVAGNRRRAFRLRKPVAFVLLGVFAVAPCPILWQSITGLRSVEHSRSLLRPLAGGAEATGLVVSVRKSCDLSCTYQPAIQFTDNVTGSVYSFTAPYQDAKPAVGSTVTVSYSRQNPAEAHDISAAPSTWDVPLFSMIFGIVVSGLWLTGGAAITAMILLRWRRRRRG
jgi:hypothetical protein